MPLGDLTTDFVLPAGVSAATSTVEEWVMDNWGWIMAITLLVIVVPPLMKKL